MDIKDIIRYGSVTTKVNHVDFKQTHSVTTYTERKAVKNYKDVLAEFLKHLKRAESGEIYNISFKVIEKDSQPRFVDLSWDIISTIQTSN